MMNNWWLINFSYKSYRLVSIFITPLLITCWLDILIKIQISYIFVWIPPPLDEFCFFMSLIIIYWSSVWGLSLIKVWQHKSPVPFDERQHQTRQRQSRDVATTTFRSADAVHQRGQWRGLSRPLMCHGSSSGSLATDASLTSSIQQRPISPANLSSQSQSFPKDHRCVTKLTFAWIHNNSLSFKWNLN